MIVLRRTLSNARYSGTLLYSTLAGRRPAQKKKSNQILVANALTSQEPSDEESAPQLHQEPLRSGCSRIEPKIVKGGTIWLFREQAIAIYSINFETSL